MLPLIEAIGVGWANTFAAALVFVGFLIVLFTIRFGREMREKGAAWGLVAAGMEEEERSETMGSTASTAVGEGGAAGKEKEKGKERVEGESN
jgi:hypothetical protein